MIIPLPFSTFPESLTMSPSISVVIPVYNGAALIGKAIRSVLAQTMLPDEIIVVNDGSTDDTLETLVAFRDSVTVISTDNRGVASARNSGIRAAAGDWIAFLDADDVWHPDKLERQFDLLDRYPGAGMSFCNFIYLERADGSAQQHFERFAGRVTFNVDAPIHPDPYDALLRENLVGTASSVVVRRDVLDQAGLFETSYRQAEDYDLWLRCALVTDMIAQSDCLLSKITHDANLTNDFLDTLLWHERVLVDIRREHAALLRQGERSRLSRSALAGVRYQIANLYFEHQQRAQACRYYLRGAGTDVSLANGGRFLYHASRKLVRLASFGLIRNPGAPA